jgi:hypothetical protein
MVSKRARLGVSWPAVLIGCWLALPRAEAQPDDSAPLAPAAPPAPPAAETILSAVPVAAAPTLAAPAPAAPPAVVPVLVAAPAPAPEPVSAPVVPPPQGVIVLVPTAPPVESPAAAPAQSQSAHGARLELSLLAALYGAAAGNLVCGLAECDDGRPWAAVNLFGAAGASTIAALATRDRKFEFSTAQAIEGGATWGLVTPVYVMLMALPDDPSPQAIFGSILAGELLGGAAGGLLERAFRPTSGAVALANSGAFWLPGFTSLLMTMDDSFDENKVRTMGGALLLSQFVGLGLGGWVGQHDGVSRGRVWLSDAGAVLGGGALPLLTWLLAGDGIADDAFLGTSAMGLAVGFVGTYLLATRLPRARAASARLERTTGDTHLSIAPATGSSVGGPGARSGVGGSLVLSGRF